MTQYYIGYFYWPAPLIAVLVVVLAATAGVAVLAVILVQAERAGVWACLEDPWYTFLMTRQLICITVVAAAP